ncbi:hypothetical protein COOONC_21381 [Cooperia oncophora]
MPSGSQRRMSLVKDDTKEDSKKEKESRLLEWIRENRPTTTTSKLPEVTVSADKLPYYGKYCGSFAEQLGATKKFKPSGAVWVVDDKRFIVSKFFFQPGSLLSENVTFWLGPMNQTENILADMFPSSNGFYVRPQPIDVSTFAADQLPPMEAKARNGLAIANLLLNGLNPIEPVVDKAKKFDDSLRARRDVTISPEEEALSTTEDNRNHVELTYAQPLEWYAGFQPLLLTLPEGIVAKSVHWISLRDHKRQVINVKTIEISDFVLGTDAKAVWFMIGKDILPNTNGHIVPIYDP